MKSKKASVSLAHKHGGKKMDYKREPLEEDEVQAIIKAINLTRAEDKKETE